MSQVTVHYVMYIRVFNRRYRWNDEYYNCSKCLVLFGNEKNNYSIPPLVRAPVVHGPCGM